MSRLATSVHLGPLTFTRLPRPSRPGVGIGLLYFCGWLVVQLFILCWWVLVGLTVGALVLGSLAVDAVTKRRS